MAKSHVHPGWAPRLAWASGQGVRVRVRVRARVRVRVSVWVSQGKCQG